MFVCKVYIEYEVCLTTDYILPVCLMYNCYGYLFIVWMLSYTNNSIGYTGVQGALFCMGAYYPQS